MPTHDSGCSDFMQLQQKLRSVQFELQCAAQVTDIQRLNSEMHDLLERVREIENFVVMPTWLQGTHDAIRQAQSTTAFLEERMNKHHATEKKLNTSISEYKALMDATFQKFCSQLQAVEQASMNFEPKEFNDAFAEINHRLVCVESRIADDAFSTRISQLENAQQKTHDDALRVSQLEDAVKELACNMKASEVSFGHELKQAAHGRDKLLLKVEDRMAAIEAAVQKGAVWLQMDELNAALSNLEGIMEERERSSDKKAKILSDELKETRDRVIKTEQTLLEKTDAQKVCELESSIAVCQAQSVEVHQKLQAKASIPQIAKLEGSLAECQGRLEQLQHEKLGTEHMQQIENFSMLQTQVENVEQEMQDRTITIERLEAQFSTLSSVIGVVQQEQLQKAGMTDLHHIDSTLRRRLASCEQAIEDKGAFLQQLKISVELLQEQGTKFSNTTSEAMNKFQDVTNATNQMMSYMEKASTELERLRQAQDDVTMRIIKLERPREFCTPCQSPKHPPTHSSQQPQPPLPSVSAVSSEKRSFSAVGGGSRGSLGSTRAAKKGPRVEDPSLASFHNQSVMHMQHGNVKIASGLSGTGRRHTPRSVHT